jgi:hypothetical protein
MVQTMDEVDFTILAATSVFTDLSEKCPPAEACRDAIDRTAKATIRMANSTGGFGQVLPRARAGSRGSVDQRDWAARSDTASSKAQRHTHHQGGEDRSLMAASQYGLPGITDAYANASQSSHLPPIQSALQRMNSLPNLKAESDGFSMMRSVPGQPRSSVTAPEAGNSPDTSAIDPSLLPSPTAVRTPPGVGSPSSNATGSAARRANMPQMPPATTAAQMAAFIAQSQAPQQHQQQPQQQQQQQQQQAGGFSPARQLNFGDLQGMDFLNQVTGNGNGSLPDGVAENQNGDFGFGLGWEGLHHDFSDGQQYDLFDGFFFGGQQGGAGHNGVL